MRSSSVLRVLVEVMERIEAIEERLDEFEKGSTLEIDLDDEKVRAVLERYSEDEQDSK